jgi:hypothetical protein
MHAYGPICLSAFFVSGKSRRSSLLEFGPPSARGATARAGGFRPFLANNTGRPPARGGPFLSRGRGEGARSLAFKAGQSRTAPTNLRPSSRQWGDGAAAPSVGGRPPAGPGRQRAFLRGRARRTSARGQNADRQSSTRDGGPGWRVVRAGPPAGGSAPRRSCPGDAHESPGHFSPR